MKTISIVCMSLLCGLTLTSAQVPYGFFRTAEDFNRNQLSLVVDSHTIQPNHWRSTPYLYWFKNGQKQKTHMDSVFAFRQKNGKVYRIWRQQCYLSVDSGPVLIFVRNNRVTQMVATPRSLHPQIRYKRDFYFSTRCMQNLLPLTIDNILKALQADDSLGKQLKKRFTSSRLLESKTGKNHFDINTFLLINKQ